jgi:WD40 repeat protein
MAFEQPDPYFVVGGTLTGNAASYVERRADAELLTALLADDYCYVLDTRQVGKSSLIVRAARRLREAGRLTAFLDLSTFGDAPTEEQWYGKLLADLVRALGLEDEADAFWEANTRYSGAQRWFLAVRDLVLPGLRAPMVVFVDEIEGVRKLPFSSDGFFAMIRALYNLRATEANAARLTFCLAGVATPADLIRDPRTTPFNIGRRITLRDFTADEMQPLAQGLCGTPDQQEAQLLRIGEWTAGHPYLTQRFCHAAFAAGRALDTREIDGLCREVFLRRQAQSEEANLQFVRRQILDDSAPDDLLMLYSRVRAGRRVETGSADALTDRLLLSGLVRVDSGREPPRLTVRNSIYAHVFDRHWAKASLSGAEAQRQRQAVRRGFLRATLIWATLTTLTALAVYEAGRASHEAGAARTARSDNKQLTHQTKVLKRERDAAAADLTATRSAIQTLNATTDHIKRDQEKLTRNMTAKLERLKQVSSSLSDARRQTRATLRENDSLASRIGAMVGPVATASAMPGYGHEHEALKFALEGVEPFLRRGTVPTRPALQGLADAVSAGVLRRLVLIHPNGVTDAAFLRGNTRLVTVGDNRFATIWDLRTGMVVQKLEVVPEAARRQVINSVTCSSDGKWIVTASEDAHVRIWNATFTGRLQKRPLVDIPTGSLKFTTAALSENGRLLVTTGPGNSAQLWRLDVGPTPSSVTAVHLFNLGDVSDKSNFVWAVDICRDGNQIATGGTDGTVKAWDVNNGIHLMASRQVKKTVRSVRFRFWQNSILFSGDDHLVHLWEPSTDRMLEEYISQMDTVYDAESSWLDFYMAAAGMDHKVRIWSFGDTHPEPIYTLNTHTGTVWNARFSSDAQELVSASADHTAEVWRLTTPTYSSTMGGVQNIAFSPDGRYVVCATTSGAVRLWEWNAGNRPLDLQGSFGICQQAVFSHDGKRILAGFSDGSLRLWNIANGSHTDPKILCEPDPGKIYTVEFDREERRILYAGHNGSATIQDLIGNGGARKFGDLNGTPVFSASFSPDGRRVVTTHRDGCTRVWNSEDTTKPLLTLCPTGRQPRDSGGSGVYPLCAVFSPDGRFVVSGDTNTKGYLWDTITRKQVGILDGHQGIVVSVAFSPDGKRIATGSSDTHVCLWDLDDVRHTGRSAPLYTLRGHGGQVTSVSFSPDGQWLATGSQDGTAHVYPATIKGMVARARELSRIPVITSDAH